MEMSTDLVGKDRLELVVDLVSLSLDALHRPLHLVPGLLVRPVAVGLRPNILSQTDFISVKKV